MKRALWGALALLGLAAPVAAQSVTITIPGAVVITVRDTIVVTDTVYVASPPDTVVVHDTIYVSVPDTIYLPAPEDTVPTPPPPPPPPPAPSGSFLFTSDWPVAGSSQAALSDGGRWNQIGGEPSVRVISSLGLGFPAGLANVLEVRSDGSREAYWHALKTGMPLPAVGESRFYRWYLRVVFPDQGVADSGTHPIQDNYAQNWDFEIINRSDGTFRPRWDAGGLQWGGPFLPKHQTFRFEFHLFRNAANTYQVHARVYDSANQLVADDADFVDVVFGGARGSLADSPSLSLTNLNALGGITAGNNGLFGAAPYPFTLTYQGAFCVRADTWCGEYVQGEGR